MNRDSLQEKLEHYYEQSGHREARYPEVSDHHIIPAATNCSERAGVNPLKAGAQLALQSIRGRAFFSVASRSAGSLQCRQHRPEEEPLVSLHDNLYSDCPSLPFPETREA